MRDLEAFLYFRIGNFGKFKNYINIFLISKRKREISLQIQLLILYVHPFARIIFAFVGQMKKQFIYVKLSAQSQKFCWRKKRHSQRLYIRTLLNEVVFLQQRPICLCLFGCFASTAKHQLTNVQSV